MPRRSPSTYTLQGYTVRESTRAKRVSIKVSRTAEVEIVVPPGCPQQRILDFVMGQQAWIDRTVKKVEGKRRSRPPEAPLKRPDTLILRSIPAEWQITYQPSSSLSIRIASPQPLQLHLSGNVDFVPNCHSTLRQWVRQQAQIYLPQWLATVSQATGLTYQKVGIRRQKTLWASCSSKSNISLNDKLMFLPFPLVRYILVHELCHTVHMNHSPDFWALVATQDPDYQTADTAMKNALQYVPDWFAPS
ncbi:MAG: SprT family zinc-dependent metalloprotease [Leptolyngbyaceae bacterium]|nr:SprT family zinc-dependent metalloprotease [Leptolyngbyaceae bacterium]